ncbi:MAG TPA: lipopolysaccharide assembly protein LapA domain-containing protein [Candidatus Nitrosocosmicus sp.]|nr:lipopolysaccharide assembly protein LapA domain-containing protein [Candidatus Nitrosocosmicus sp.]
MLTLIVTLIIGIAIAIFATQNTSGVTISLGGYILNQVPLYLIVTGSLLIGLLVSAIINSIQGIGSSLTIMGKDNKIKASSKTVNDLNNKIRQLELENAKLRGENEATITNPTRNIDSI